MKRIMDNGDVNMSAKKWYHEYPKAATPTKHSKPEVEVITLKSDAKKHLEGETAAYTLKQSKCRDSEFEWLKTALTKGTSADKIAASIVLIQENPKYNLTRLVALITQVKGSKHAQSNLLISSLRDLFISDLLHPEHKLLKFEEQDLDKIPLSNQLSSVNNGPSRSKLLSHFYFEDQLREQYEKFITALSAVASDTVDANREKAVSVMTDLLIGNSEQEHRLLEFLVNKIGDPRSKVASKSVFCLNKLLLEHPNMKLVVLREVEKLLFRKNIASRAQYYAICLLTQFVLDRNDTETATCLIDVYFAFFKACLKKGEPDSRMMAAILTGVNRAYRFANLEAIKLTEHIDSVYKVVHVGSFNVSLNALSLLHQVVGKNPQLENRFYTAFYRKLFDPQIGVVNKRAIFLNLLYRVMKSDKSLIRLVAFIKRVRQVALQFPACMTFATLYVVQQVCQSRKDLKQILSNTPVMIKEEKNEEFDEIDDDDVHIEHEQQEENTITLSNVVTEAAASNDEIKDVIKIEEDTATVYDPFATNPLRSGATKAPAAELIALSRHYHPSVALIANTNIEGKEMDCPGDPLKDLTLIRFLDRFAFKNPKKLEEKKIVKTNDPLAMRAKYTPKGLRSLAVDSVAYLRQREERIPADELFLYQFLKNKNESRTVVVKDDDNDSDNESVNSEEFNDLLDKFSGDKDFEELDIAADLGSMKKKNKLTELEDDDDSVAESEDEEPDGSDDDFDDELNESDEDLDLSEVDLDGVDDEDLSDMEFNDDHEDHESESKLKSKLNKILPKKGKKGKGLDSNVFVAAEEFAEMLEEQGRSKLKSGGSNMFSDADGASAKQVNWEINRNQKISGKFGGKKRAFKSGFTSKNIKKFKRKN